MSAALLLDIGESLVADGMDVNARSRLESLLEESGHNLRAGLDPAYKRATWGMRGDAAPREFSARSGGAGASDPQAPAPPASLKELRAARRAGR